MAAVFVDDYCLAAVENASGTLIQRFSRAALHAIHGVFPPPSVTGHKGGKDPISEKKASRGDTRFEITKELLGFDVDGKHRTIRLPAKKAEAIVTELRRLLKKKRVRLKRLQQIVGKLQHASLVMPATKALFNPLYNAMKGNPRYIYLPAPGLCRTALRDFIGLTQEASRRPTHVHEIIARAGDEATGLCDASGFGAGGVWFINNQHLVWRVVWPLDIQQAVVSTTNPRGTVTNSDLELAAIVLHYMVLQDTGDLRHKKTVTFSDNTPAVVWSSTMRSKSHSNTAYHLLRGLTSIVRDEELCTPEINHISGPLNAMADTSSRPINVTSNPRDAYMNQPSHGAPDVRDAQFVAYFNSRFPLQHASWQVVHPGPAKLSKAILTLRGECLPRQQWTTRREIPTGPTGSGTATWLPAPTPTSNTPTPPPNGSSCSHSLPAFVQVTLDAESKFNHKASKQHSVTYHKPSCWRDTRTPDAQAARKTWTWPSPTPTEP